MLKNCIFSFIIFCASISATEYLLVPDITFIETRGNLYYDIKQLLTETCGNIEFHYFNVYVLSGSNWVDFGLIDKRPEWTKNYQFYQNKELVSTHRAYYNFDCFFDATKTFEVMEGDSTPIGYIDGSFFTSQAAEFSFYDKTHQLFAKARLDPTYATLIIESVDGSPIYSCKKLFHYNFRRYDLFSYVFPQVHSHVPNQYKWHIIQNEDQTFDSRFFWPFICFISEVWWAGQTL